MKINELVEIHTGTNSVNRLNHLLQSQTWRLDVTRSSEQVLVPAVPLADEHVKANRVTVLLRHVWDESCWFLSAALIVQRNKVWRGVNDEARRLLSGVWSSLLTLSLHYRPVTPRMWVEKTVRGNYNRLPLNERTPTVGWKVSRWLSWNLTEQCRCVNLVKKVFRGSWETPAGRFCSALN